MNIKTRLAKLEEDYATRVLQAPNVGVEKTKKWLDDVINSLPGNVITVTHQNHET